MRVPNCGGNWNNGSNNGVFYVNLNNSRGNSNTNIGFRSARPPQVGLGRGSRSPVQNRRLRSLFPLRAEMQEEK